MKTVKKYQSKKTSAAFTALKDKGYVKEVPKVSPDSTATPKPKTYVWNPNAKPDVYDGRKNSKKKMGGSIKKKK